MSNDCYLKKEVLTTQNAYKCDEHEVANLITQMSESIKIRVELAATYDRKHLLKR